MCRSSACKMVRTLVQLMRTLDRMPEEITLILVLVIAQLSMLLRIINSLALIYNICMYWYIRCNIVGLLLFQRTILMKLHYYDDVTVYPLYFCFPIYQLHVLNVLCVPEGDNLSEFAATRL